MSSNILRQSLAGLLTNQLNTDLLRHALADN